MTIDPEEDGAQMNFDGKMSYGDYLCLDNILNSQTVRTSAHDEMLFIIQHQASELWLKLALHELNGAREAIKQDNLQKACKMLSRVTRIFEQLNNAWDVLRTMTPSEYTEFRDELGQSSGFQSYQYRLIEFVVGNRNSSMVKPHKHKVEILKKLNFELSCPTIYDEALYLLNRSGIKVSKEILDRDLSKTHKPNTSVIAAWKKIYQDPTKFWPLYELAEKLTDFEDYFRRWRFNHVTTVERIIGFKRGTGGTSGTHYLRQMLDVELFPELWHVRTEL
jgi:tryptophan 2,3-dioxygenase